ncbi:hypothetical protein [Microvirga sp. Mcv34]|uniref:hypothetical protein n=1 Tax=Microvirga sp. Mcv34 TaxID=2926016 RepID=UPI0021C9616C|nr:hypothetical protein [Microvirga sp. Mcv34]
MADGFSFADAAGIPKIPATAVRVGVDRRTGKILQGWDHVEQSIASILSTRFHERILREWVGSFVPHMLGESATPEVISRHFWAIATAVSLFEPCYRITRVRLRNPEALDSEEAIEAAVDRLRSGHLQYWLEGVYMPRGHLGDFTPEGRRSVGLIDRGGGIWDRASA